MTLNKETVDTLVKLRRELHAHPEVSCEEKETARKIASHLNQLENIEVHEKIGGTGVIGIYDTKIAGPSILFRAELDALPIQEINSFSYRSKIDDVSHKCGHDGHMTMLTGLVHAILSDPPKSGRVIFLYQPAEENGEGAKAIMQDSFFLSLNPDIVIALHNLPGYDMHEIVLRRNAFTASVKSLIIKLNGKTSHAAEPEFGINPAWPIWKILKKSDELSNNDVSRKDLCVITPVYIKVGDLAYGISAGQGDLRLTIRTWDEKHMKQYTDELLESIKEICEHYKIDYDLSWTQEFSANKNHDEIVDILFAAASEKGYNITERDHPLKWGEDFGLFTQHYKGAMFGLGSGKNTPALHNPDYDFPDDLIPTGVGIFHSIAKKILG